MGWIVKLVKKPTINDFRAGFFPRKFHLKKDAEELKKEVAQKGGEALVEKTKKILREASPPDTGRRGNQPHEEKQ